MYWSNCIRLLKNQFFPFEKQNFFPVYCKVRFFPFIKISIFIIIYQIIFDCCKVRFFPFKFLKSIYLNQHAIKCYFKCYFTIFYFQMEKPFRASNSLLQTHLHTTFCFFFPWLKDMGLKLCQTQRIPTLFLALKDAKIFRHKFQGVTSKGGPSCCSQIPVPSFSSQSGKWRGGSSPRISTEFRVHRVSTVPRFRGLIFGIATDLVGSSVPRHE